MLSDIKARAKQQSNTLSPTLAHFFLVLERAMCDNSFDQSLHIMENVLTVFIRGFDIILVPCPA